MPAKKRITAPTAPTAPEQPNTPAPTDDAIINRIRMGNGIPNHLVRILIKTAHRKKQLEIHIGINGNQNEIDANMHPSNPMYCYNGRDIKKLKYLIVNNKTVLSCSATLCYGDGGMSIETEDDIKQSIEILTDDYREPKLILFF